MRQNPTRLPYSCQAQFGMSGIGAPPAGGVSTVRGIEGLGRTLASLSPTGVGFNLMFGPNVEKFFAPGVSGLMCLVTVLLLLRAAKQVIRDVRAAAERAMPTDRGMAAQPTEPERRS